MQHWLSNRTIIGGLMVLLSCGGLSSIPLAQAQQTEPPKKPLIPHAQDKAPNEPRDPQTAAKMMTVPEGFSVEVVASEPDIVNPVAMAIDERGRFWITESLEYPRREPGVGKDRVKVLEDTDGDGKCDKFSVFLDGLNIPSGIAVGHGGVWIANAPDILFVPDADRDGKADGPAQVVVTGFGRTDTHELPNSLTWGPDGWLYGLNGVFNYSKVTYPKDSPWLKTIGAASSHARQSVGDAKKDADGAASHVLANVATEFTFTCAMFRIHPRTREFQIFCEGTSNPWGIAFNDEGEAFISACVIDHLWHLTETGYYHRQGGPYPPFTWKIESIVKHKHQKAAYCGIHYFDSDAYPEKYRGKLYMGNIHGGCINVDRIERDGSTYKGFGEDDFLTANDAWFMPVVQKTGPDGCLYILDWYDRYHCSQDANRDPAGIDRLKGRLYRVRYNGKLSDAKPKREGEAPAEPRTSSDPQRASTPGSAGASPSRAARLYPQMDLAKETDEQLIERLGANNDFIRSASRRILQERATPEIYKSALAVAANQTAGLTARLGATHTIAGMQRPDHDWYRRLSIDKDSGLRAWAVRMYGDDPVLRQSINEVCAPWIVHRSPEVRLQAAIAVAKAGHATSTNQFEYLIQLLARPGDDPIIQRIVWQNLHPHLEQHPNGFIDAIKLMSGLKSKPVADLMPRVADRILGRQKFDAKPVADLFSLLRDDHPQIAKQVLEVISAKVQSGELKGEKLDQLKAAMAEPLTSVLADGSKHPLAADAALLATSWGDPKGLAYVRRSFETAGLQPDARLKALNALVAAKDKELLESVEKVLDSLTRRREDAKENKDTPPLRGSAPSRESVALTADVLTALAKIDDLKVSDLVLARYAQLEPELQPAAIELLTQRANWSKQLLAHVADKKLAATSINVNQARRMQALKDKELSEMLNRHWGQVRDTRNPNREKVVAEMKALIRKTPGDALAGEKVFKRVCAACHKIYGEGPDVGPDITLNGRNDFNQLLSNVFDPSLVIGAGYRVCTVITNAGRVQSGLLVEDSPQRVVLKPASVLRPIVEKPDAPVTPVAIAVGKLEIIPRDEIDEFNFSELSLMPEGLEKQLSSQEIVDLFAFITLDKHPSDKTAKRLPGVTAVTPRQSTKPADFPSLVAEILPGFTTGASGVEGVALLNNHFGRDSVLRTHPVSRDSACVLTQKFSVPAGTKTKLILDVAHDPRGDWRLVVRGNGERMADEMVSKETCSNGWRSLTVDLTKFAGQELTLGLVNQANDWSYEFAYWGAARIVSE